MTHNKGAKGLAAVALTALLAGYSHAAFTSVDKKPFSASVTLSGAGTVQLSAILKDRVSNALDGGTNLTWTKVSPAPGAGFLLADQYIQVNTTFTVSGGGGVQIYTDNMAADASPKFTGDKTVTTPAGLVANDGKTKLPTTWRIASSTDVVASAVDPNGANPEHSAWFFHEDASQVAITNLGAAAFANADDYITVYKANAGLHFGQGPTEYGGFKVVDQNYIYTGADFTAATTPNTYGTNKLIVEAYTL